MTLAGRPEWENYDVSVDLESISNGDEAGIVFYLTLSPLNYYYFGVDHNPEIPGNPDAGTCKIWKYINGTRDASPLAEADISIGYPMHLRMTRQDDGSFLCWANGTQLSFSEASPYTGGFVGLRVEAGTATFDNVAVHGANAFLIDAETQPPLEEPLIDDPFTRIDVDGTPYMWGLLGEHPTLANESAWQVVKDDSAHGLVLKGTASTTSSAEAFRGDRGWINDEGETDWMDYRVQADVKLESATLSEAGVCLRVRKDDVGPGDRFYELRLNAEDGEVQFGARQWVQGPPGFWYWDELGAVAFSELDPVPDPTDWHTISVQALSSEFYTTFTCCLDGNQCIPDVEDAWYPDGLVGLWVESDAALYDNVRVLDLR